MDYATLEGIENRTGIGEENLHSFILKEVLDNASDSLETHLAKKAQVKVIIAKKDNILRIVVRNSNNSSKFSFSRDKLESIFNFDTFYGSKRNQYKLNRGALGDAFKEILCVPYALARKYGIDWKQPLTITTAIDSTQYTFSVSLLIDRIDQTIHTAIEELKREGETESNFTEIEVRLPVIEDMLHLDKLKNFLIDYATVNTHIDFTFNLPISSDTNLRQTLNFPQIQHINTKWINLSSIYYYSLSEFQNFIFGLDKSNDNTQIYNIVQKTFREGSNMKKTELVEMSVGQLKQTPHYIDQLYFELRNTMKPISSPSNLSLPFETNKKVRIEIDSVLATVNDNAAFLNFILSKLEDRFPTRDYNRAIDIPEYVNPPYLEELNKQVREKCTLILKPERNKMRNRFSNTKGFLDVKQYNERIPVHFQKIIEGNEEINPLLSRIKELTQNQE
jgi:hypothetical protein